MKKLIVLFLAILALIGGPAMQVHARRLPPPPPLVSTTKVYGVNYGHNFADTGYDPVLAGKDLDELKAAGVKAVRIFIAPYDNSDVVWTQKLAVLAKQKGLVVIWGVCTGGWVHDMLGWSNFITHLPGDAQWAWNNHIDYFSLGNEEELNDTGLTDTEVQTDIRNAATAIKLIYPQQKLTYGTAAYPNLIDNWAVTGDLDSVGFNVYVDFPTLVGKIKQNPKGIITEWNTLEGINAVRGSETRWASALVADRNIINQAGVPAYLFVLRGNGGGIDNRWSMWLGNTRRTAWKELIK